MKRLFIVSIVALSSLLLLLHPGCKESSFNLEDVIKIIPIGSTDHLMADGLSTVTFQAEIDKDSTEKSITFTATGGTFVGALGTQSIAVAINDSGIAQATLKVGRNPGSSEVVASVSSYRAVYTLKLKIAHAESLSWESSSMFVSKSNLVMPTIKAFLSRGTGSVSNGAPVRFFATQLNDQNQDIEVGRFLNKIGTTSGVATITFAADKADVVLGKPVKIRIESNKDDGSPIQDQLFLTVIE